MSIFIINLAICFCLLEGNWEFWSADKRTATGLWAAWATQQDCLIAEQNPEAKQAKTKWSKSARRVSDESYWLLPKIVLDWGIYLSNKASTQCA